MKKCILIGGGDIGRGNTTYELQEIDEKIVKIIEKEKPTLLFIGLASSYSDSYYDTIKKNYQKLGCNTLYLKKKNILNNPEIVKEKFHQADIIYIGGGDTIKLLNEVKEYKLDLLLKEAYDRECLLVGYSAGAILLCKEGFSDSYILRKESEHYEFVQGLSIVPICICPHYHETNQKTEELKTALKNQSKIVYGLENQTALLVTKSKLDKITINSKEIFVCSNQKRWQEKYLK